MATDDVLKRLEERLSKIEAALTQAGPVGGGGFTPPGGAVVDPAPWPGGPGGWHPPRWPWPWPGPWPWPNPIADPAPWPNPVVDPAPGGGFGGGVFTQRGAGSLAGRIGPIGDPAPIDISRFTISQLESSLHSIRAEQSRLSAMESMIKQQMEKLK